MTVEPQVWSEGRSFPGQVWIDERGPALETAMNWRAWSTIWTDEFRFDTGEVGAACAWKRGDGSWTGRSFHLSTNKEDFDAEVFAIYQALRAFEERPRVGHHFTIFADSQAAIQRIRTDGVGPGQCWARAAIEVCSRLIARGNEVSVFRVPARSGIVGNEMADQLAKEAAGGQQQHSVQDELRWEASLSHLSRVITGNLLKATAQWVASHVRPERRYRPPTGSGLRRKPLRRVRMSLASRYYQLLSGHAAIDSFLHERMTGPLRRESSECQWCRCGKRESCHHILVECRPWAPQIRRLWQRVAKDCR